jgi:hypothetical protein
VHLMSDELGLRHPLVFKDFLQIELEAEHLAFTGTEDALSTCGELLAMVFIDRQHTRNILQVWNWTTGHLLLVT